jgi:hypothetical protein
MSVSHMAAVVTVTEVVAERIHEALDEGLIRTADPEDADYEERQRAVRYLIDSLSTAVVHRLFEAGVIEIENPPQVVPKGNADPKLFGSFKSGFDEGHSAPPKTGETYKQLQLPGMEDDDA